MATTATRKSTPKPSTAKTPPSPPSPPTSRKPAAKRVTAKKAAPAAKRPAQAPTVRPAAKAVAKRAAKPVTEAAHKPKQKLVRDSFTMPQQDFDLIATLKKRALSAGHAAKKSELLRAGLHALTRLDDGALRTALEGLLQLKAGRPRKSR